MRILVVGGAGYIGSHVARSLAEWGHDVSILDNLSTGHRDAARDLPLHLVDVADAARVDALLRERRIEAVVYLAARSLVAESVQHPELYYENNVVGGYRFLEALREAGVRRLVFSSSAAVYGEPEGVPISEEHPLRPTNTYGETKRVFEGLLRAYQVAYGMSWIALRYFNAAGAWPDGSLGEDHRPESHLIPLLLQAAAGQREGISIFGTDYPTPDGTAIRDYVHVLDLAEAHRLALERLDGEVRGEVYNLGNGAGYSVRQVLEAVRRVTGRRVSATEAPRRPGDPAVLVAAAQAARGVLGWEVRRPALETMIESAWTFLQAHPEGFC